MVIWKLGYVILLLLLSVKREMKAPEDSFHVDQKANQGRICGPARRSTKGHWTIEEDETLRKAVEHFERKNWKKIAECLKNRTDVQCLHRWQKVLDPELVKGAWSKEEDNTIIALVEKHGPKKWSTISQHLPGRIGKQCRERWHNHLNPAINKNAWTQEEELILVRAHQIYGNKWAELTKFLPGRSDNSIKNHWNSSVKKNLDSYYASGLLDQYQSLPLIESESTVFSSSQSLNDLPEEVKFYMPELSSLAKQQISNLIQDFDLDIDGKNEAVQAFQSSVRLCDQPSLSNLDTGSYPQAQTLITDEESCSVLFLDSNKDNNTSDPNDGFIDIDGHVTSHGNEGNDSVLEHQELSYIPNDSLKLLPLNSFSSPSKVFKVFSPIEDKPAGEKDKGSLCYEPPRFPSADLPFLRCDLVSDEVREEYSPFGLRQLMISPLKLWDSHVLDLRKEKKLKRGPLRLGDSPSKAKDSRDSASALLDRDMTLVYEEPKEALESKGVTSKEASTENDQETSESLIEIGLCSPRPYSKVDAIAKDESNSAETNLSIENFSIFDGTPFTKLLDSPSPWKSPPLFGPFLTCPNLPQEITFEDMSPAWERTYDALGLMKHLSEQTATTFADALEVLGDDTPESILKKRELNKKSIQGKENQHQLHDQLVNQSQLNVEIQVESCILDFSDCETPRKASSASPGGYSSPSSYLL